jgi:hypothetical protein
MTLRTWKLQVSGRDIRRDAMCPACIATAALITISATSTGGLAALLVTKLPEGAGAKKNRAGNSKSRRAKWINSNQ